MKSTPAFLLKDCALWFNQDVKVGQATKMTLPPMKVKTETFRNAGMATERKARYGYVRENAKFSNLGFDPQILRGFNIMPGRNDELMITGALVDEDGVVNNATCYMRGFTEELNLAEWASGQKVDAIDSEFAWDYCKLEVAGTVLLEADDFDLAVNGESQYGAIRAALLL